MRLSPIDRNQLSADQQQVLDNIEQGPRGQGRSGIGLIGPFGVWVRCPGVGNPVQQLGTAVRFQTSLPENIKEVAICTVGVFYQARFEFSAHKRLAIKAGVSEDCLNRLRDGDAPGFEGDEDLAYRFADDLLNNHRVADPLYQEAMDQFGEQGVIELNTAIGYYCLISLTLNNFDVPLEPGMEDPFAD